MTQDLAKLAEELEHLLKLRSIPFGMKLCERREEMEAIPRIRRPKAIHTMDQLVGQTARLGFTIGVTAEDLVGSQCRSVVGLGNAKSPLDALSKGLVAKLLHEPTVRLKDAAGTVRGERLADALRELFDL